MPRDSKAAVMKVAGPPGESPSVHLDALRGFAAFCVLLNHFRDALFVDYEAIARHNPLTAAAYLVSGLGHQSVIVFFVLSSYLVGASVLRSVRKGNWSWRAYLLARFSRLYVVLLPALLLGGALDWLGMHRPGTEAVYSGNSGMHALAINVHSTLTWPVLVANNLFLQTITIHLPGFAPMRYQHLVPMGRSGA
jgi:peptidoglycan/LPS O-acetylase OafA/YrhL